MQRLSEFLNSLASALAERINEKGEFKELLRVFLAQHDSTGKCPFVVDVLKRRQSWLESRVAGGAPVFSWRMPKATMPHHPQVEAFLHSDQVEFKYQFDPVGHLRNFISFHSDTYGWNGKSGFSAEMSEMAGKICLIKKTTKMFDQQTAEFNANTQELNNIKKFLKYI